MTAHLRPARFRPSLLFAALPAWLLLPLQLMVSPGAARAQSAAPALTVPVVGPALDGAALEAYHAARSPVSIGVGIGVGVAGVGALAPELSPLAFSGGVAAPVVLPRLSSAAPGAAVPPAAVAIQFAPARGGARVWVQPLDGGRVDNALGGRLATLSPTGALLFSFQAPARSDRYRVMVRLDNVQTILSFEVPSVD